MRLEWTAGIALTALAMMGCDDQGPIDACRCEGSIPGGHVNLACGESQCVAGRGFVCAEANVLDNAPSACVTIADGGPVATDAGTDAGSALPGCAIRQGTWRLSWTLRISSSEGCSVAEPQEVFVSSLDELVGIGSCPDGCTCSETPASPSNGCIATHVVGCPDTSSLTRAIEKLDDDNISMFQRLVPAPVTSCEVDGVGEFLRP